MADRQQGPHPPPGSGSRNGPIHPAGTSSFPHPEASAETEQGDRIRPGEEGGYGGSGRSTNWRDRQLVDTSRAVGGILRRWWLLIPLTLLGAAAGYAASLQVRPAYEATTSVLVGEIFEDPNLTKDYVETTQSLTATYADVAKREPVLQEVVDRLRLRAHWTQLRNRVRVVLPPSNPQLISLTVEADSPDDAEAIATELANRLVAMSPTEAEVSRTYQIRDFVQSRLDSLQQDISEGQRRLDFLQSQFSAAASETERNRWGRRIEAQRNLIIDWQNNYSTLLSALATKESPNTLRTLEPATSSEVPVRPNTRMNTALGAGAALCLAMAIAYALEFRRSRSGRMGSSDRRRSLESGEEPLRRDTHDEVTPSRQRE
jgi:capsular polysaccharide biosynthesis protein